MQKQIDSVNEKGKTEDHYAILVATTNRNVYWIRSHVKSRKPFAKIDTDQRLDLNFSFTILCITTIYVSPEYR